MRDDLSAIAAGVAATAVLMLILFVGDALTGFTVRAFAVIAEFVGSPGNILVGFVMFVIVGVAAWPLVFLSVESYLPGDTPVVRGMVFSIPLWVGYVSGFPPEAGAPFGLYLALTLVAHVAYGATLGGVVERLADRTTGTP